MSRKYDKERDPYTFSLRGLSTIASFVAPTAIEIDRMNRARDERRADSSERPPDSDDASSSNRGSLFGRFWLRSARRSS